MTAPVEPDAGTARRWLATELADPAYTKSWLQVLREWFAGLWERAASAVPGPDPARVVVAALVAAALVAALVALARWRGRRAVRHPALVAGHHGRRFRPHRRRRSGCASCRGSWTSPRWWRCCSPWAGRCRG